MHKVNKINTRDKGRTQPNRDAEIYSDSSRSSLFALLHSLRTTLESSQSVCQHTPFRRSKPYTKAYTNLTTLSGMSSSNPSSNQYTQSPRGYTNKHSCPLEFTHNPSLHMDDHPRPLESSPNPSLCGPSPGPSLYARTHTKFKSSHTDTRTNSKS